MSIGAKLCLGDCWITTPVLLDSGTEISLIYLRLLRPEDLIYLDNYIVVSALFNTIIKLLGSCDLYIQVQDSFRVVD